MCELVEAKPLPNYKIWLRFADGVQGEVDLSSLTGKGVFAAWREPGMFERAFVDPESGALAWPNGIDLCPDSLYEDLTGRALAAQAVSNA